MGCELRAGIAHVPLNVGVGGALTSDSVREVTRTIERLGGEHECRAIVLNSQGGLFGAGFDLAEAGDAAARGDDTPAQDFAACLLAISHARQPVIAAVDGKAAAGAMGLVAASDIVIASLRATFQLPEMAFGMLPAIITPYLRRRMPPARLRYLVLSSRTVDVREAHSSASWTRLRRRVLTMRSTGRCEGSRVPRRRRLPNTSASSPAMTTRRRKRWFANRNGCGDPAWTA
jgi:enoyl-CoA hydratase/carnithine racemase